MSDLLLQIKEHYKLTIDAYRESRTSQLSDLKFAAGSPDNKWQWDPLALATRAGGAAERPALTVNVLGQHIRQVTNEQRQNRPAIKVLPVDDKADPETAKIFNGLIRHIEVASDSSIAIDTACDSQVTVGEGYFRVVAEYCDPLSFDQDLRIKRIKDSFSVRMDPRIQIPTGEDAKFCFIESEMPKDEFEKAFPDAAVVDFQASDPSMSTWRRDNAVLVVEYYYVEEAQKKICLWPDGNVTVAGDGKEAAYEGQKPVAERTATIPQVKWCKSNGFEILGKVKDIPGKFIPVFRVVGNEWLVEGEIVVSGIVRNAKDPQRMYNYWTSQEAEMLALAPKAPFVGASGQFEGFESKWRDANVVNFPYLEYNPIVADGNVPVPPPQRMPPPMPPSGIIEAKLQAIDAVKQATGQYNPSLGAQGNETSGKAIIARQREADVGTYHYVDNLDRAIRSCGRYLVDVIPVYYDRKRVARIVGEDGEPDHATIDPQSPTSYQENEVEGGEIERIYNPAVGKYDVVSTVGPSYTTKRLEAVDAMTQLLQGNEGMWGVFGDLLVKNMDWPGADEIAERIKRTIPPNILGDDKEGGKAPDPRLEQAMTMVDELTKQLHATQSALDSKEKEDEIKVYEAETKRLAQVKDAIPPDLWPEIIVRSGVLTSQDLDAISERGIVESHPSQPEQPAEAPTVQ